MFTEVAPKKIDTTKEKVEQADQKLQALSAESRKAQFQADSLALARDLAQVGNVYRDVVKSENSIRQERIMHLRGQNCIGAALVADYMSLNMAVHAGSLKEQISLADRFLTRFPQYPCVVWCDLMKCGRLTQQEVNDYCDLMHSIFKKSPMSVAVLVAPYLVSEKVAGYRGELRRWEDKMDARGFKQHSIAIRCQPPNGRRKVPLHFDGWVVMMDLTAGDNVWSPSQLIQDRSNRNEIPWTPEGQYVVPVAQKDNLPHASEGMRSLSDVQECAQFLAGEALPCGLLSALLGRTEVPKQTDTCVLINLTAYDSWVERACKRFSDQTTIPIKFKTLSMSKTISTAEYVEKTLACELLEEWKRGNHKHLGQVRAYEPKPPASSATDVDPNQYPLKLIKLDYDPNPSLKGWNKFRISIPPGVRARYIDDQVFGEDWSNILKDFDQKYSPKSNADATAALALVKKEEEDATKVIEPWTNEPETLEELMDKYIVEAKFPGRNHGSTMFLVQSKARDGSSHQIIQGQKYKLFVATRLVYHSFGCSPHKMFSYQC
ncbi:unnamed protein product [Cladocopium goreaui]|uniref:Uncharacterized protein n=1 Tax=Cladocopium goreaui TaxID=2562237 RepID=A0A9P1M5K1_9DINO|nr:unnamed protein product [Cladocopium goreaui]